MVNIIYDFILDVPYNRKNEVKAYRAVWLPDRKSWRLRCEDRDLNGLKDYICRLEDVFRAFRVIEFDTNVIWYDDTKADIVRICRELYEGKEEVVIEYDEELQARKHSEPMITSESSSNMPSDRPGHCGRGDGWD